MYIYFHKDKAFLETLSKVDFKMFKILLTFIIYIVVR